MDSPFCEAHYNLNIHYACTHNKDLVGPPSIHVHIYATLPFKASSQPWICLCTTCISGKSSQCTCTIPNVGRVHMSKQNMVRFHIKEAAIGHPPYLQPLLIVLSFVLVLRCPATCCVWLPGDTVQYTYNVKYVPLYALVYIGNSCTKAMWAYTVYTVYTLYKCIGIPEGR